MSGLATVSEHCIPIGSAGRFWWFFFASFRVVFALSFFFFTIGGGDMGGVIVRFEYPSALVRVASARSSQHAMKRIRTRSCTFYVYIPYPSLSVTVRIGVIM